MTFTVEKQENGTWAVLADGEIVSENHPTHENAWRAADVLDNQPLNKSQARSDWVAEQILRGNP